MSTQQITDDLRKWLVEQIEAGQTPGSVLQSLKDSGWHDDVALAAMEETLKARHSEGKPAWVAIPDISDPDGPTMVWAHDRHVRILMQIQLPRVVLFGDFLSAEECATLIADATPKLTRSTTIVNETGGDEVHADRTSQGMFFERGANDLCTRIEARIEALLNWPAINGEGIQILSYPPGAEYKPHHDYFEPGQPGTEVIVQRGGQRVGTLIMYLNTPEEGGGTVFPDIGLLVHAVAGQAVFFSYGIPDVATKTLHGGAPVIRGDKWIATKWLRQTAYV